MDETNVQAENSNQAEEVALESTEEASNDETSLAEELAKARELANNYKIRAEKAERKAKGETHEVTSKAEVSDLSQQDTIAIIRNNVHEDDVSEVAEYAKLKNISISEALKSNIVKNILSENQEKRQTAQATNASASRRGSTKVTGEDLLDQASKGKMPDDVEALARARLEAKRKK